MFAFLFHQLELTSFQVSVGWEMRWLSSQQGGISIAMPALSPHQLPVQRGAATAGLPADSVAHRLPTVCSGGRTGCGLPSCQLGRALPGCAAGTMALGVAVELNADHNLPSFYTSRFCVCLLLPLLLNNS